MDKIKSVIAKDTPNVIATLPKAGVYQKLLVALDDGETNERVFQKSLALAQQFEAKLMLVHCVQPSLGLSESRTFATLGGYSALYSCDMLQLEQQAAEEARARLTRRLRSLSERASEVGISAEFDPRNGDPGQEICLAANYWQADLIVVGRRGRKGLSEMLLGSVSNYVLHNANCSVLVLQPSETP
ncbi:MAG: universal stress protein [Cyanobacteria bacterium P01_H01_bin.15]